MATKISPDAVTALTPPTQQVAGKSTPDTTAKTSGPKSAAGSGKRRGKVSGKKPVTAASVKKSKAGVVTKPKTDAKPKKIKMVRDSYTMPENDYAKLTDLKKKCLKAGVHVKKSELLRAGLATLTRLPATTLFKTIEGLVKIKTGRPGKH